MQTQVGLYVMLVAYFCQFPLLAEYILTTINEELLAASAFLAQSGALLVSVNIMLA
jgi:hypothetical protein